jgi:hypothetical protein
MHCGRRSHNPPVAQTSGCPKGCFGAAKVVLKLGTISQKPRFGPGDMSKPFYERPFSTRYKKNSIV